MLFRSQRMIESPWITFGCGALGGFLGTRAMEPVTTLLYEHEDEADKRREEELRKEPPFQTLKAACSSSSASSRVKTERGSSV